MTEGAVGTEVWFRNPNAYIRELVETGQKQIIWDRGFLVKKGIDPIKHAELYYGLTGDWRVMICGVQGTAEYRSGDTLQKPSAVYPTWEYGEDASILLEMIEHPAGDDRAACADRAVSGDERPVWGQEHRVVITELPPASRNATRNFLRWLKEVQEDHPDCIVHVHGTYAYRVAFGLGFGAADVEPRTDAQKGKVVTPAGKVEQFERLKAHPQWATSLGFLPAELSIPRNRCMYNIKSAVWAGANYRSFSNFMHRSSSKSVDTVTPDATYAAPTTAKPIIGLPMIRPDDKQLCDTCSLQDKCKQYRSGAVCSLPDAEPARLAKVFKTRDAEQIIDGLGTLMAVGANRLEYGMRLETALDEIDPEVTKMLNQLFNQGTVLAKLLDPKLRGGGVKVNIGQGAGGQNVNVSVNPNTLIAGVFRQLQQQGIPRDQITPAMVENVLAAMGSGTDQQQVIEGAGAVVNEKTA